MGYHPQFRFDIGDDATREEVPDATARVTKLHELRQDIQEHWRKATEAQAKGYNNRHKAISFNKGSLVGLSTKNLRLEESTSKKLTPRFLGPFRILQKIGKQAYRLALPEKYSRIHNVFHVSLLEPWTRRGGDPGETLPMPDLNDPEEEWEVEAIKEERSRKGETSYLVKWKGWPAEYNEWVAAADLGNAQTVLQGYKQSLAKGRRKKAEQPAPRQQSGNPKKRGRPRRSN
jgi:hypothetical protein